MNGMTIPSTRAIGTKLPDRQRAILAHIHNFTIERGFAPTHLEIAGALGVANKSIVTDAVRMLERKRLVTRVGKLARSTKLTTAGLVAIGVEVPNMTVLTEARADRFGTLLDRARNVLSELAPEAPLLAEIEREQIVVRRRDFPVDSKKPLSCVRYGLGDTGYAVRANAEAVYLDDPDGKSMQLTAHLAERLSTVLALAFRRHQELRDGVVTSLANEPEWMNTAEARR